ncbi:NAD(P)/FAD-dependent oxidoreductase [Spirochaetota bacterium]
MKLIVDNIVLKPDEELNEIKIIVKKKYNIEISKFQILRKSLDSRKKNNIVFKYRVIIDILDEKLANELLQDKNISLYQKKNFPKPVKNLKGLKAIVIGTGPAGLFCTLRLIEAGAVVSIFERGKSIKDRMADIKILENDGLLNEESNVLFGEGGAGTYSDGKLTTRINRPEVDWFYKTLVQCGAHKSILYESKPHLGTDKLRKIIKEIRTRIEESGSKIHFNEKLTDLIIKNNEAIGIITSLGNEYLCEKIMMATGHSARDIYELLSNKNVALEKKGFAIGVRVEHPRDFIDSIQYGNSKYKKILPAADYNLAFNNKKSGRGIYTFCMCPGGSIINSSSQKNMLCTNGMSLSSRNSEHSNSAIVVTVNENDVGDKILSGIDFQQKIEEAAFITGGSGFKAPAQKIESFMNNKLDNHSMSTSYKLGTVPAMLRDYLPPWIEEEIKNAINIFNNKMRGFRKGVLIGAETRTSSPVRIKRRDDYQSVNTKGLYPIGEGAGYSGGIVSSAVDGIRAADYIISES